MMHLVSEHVGCADDIRDKDRTTEAASAHWASQLQGWSVQEIKEYAEHARKAGLILYAKEQLRPLPNLN